MGATFNIVITGRTGRVAVPDPKTQKIVIAEDKTPQTVQYLDLRHAYLEAPRLAGLLQANPLAEVEVRPPDLAAEAKGKTMSLSAWVAQCAKGPIPARSGNSPTKAKFASQIESLLAQAAELQTEEATATA